MPIVALLVGGSVAATPALAQERARVIEEVVVTAQAVRRKKKSLLEDVPFIIPNVGVSFLITPSEIIFIINDLLNLIKN